MGFYMLFVIGVALMVLVRFIVEQGPICAFFCNKSGLLFVCTFVRSA